MRTRCCHECDGTGQIEVHRYRIQYPPDDMAFHVRVDSGFGFARVVNEGAWHLDDWHEELMRRAGYSGDVVAWALVSDVVYDGKPPEWAEA